MADNLSDTTDQSIRPFSIDIPAADLADLKTRIGNTRWPEAETSGDWNQGIPLAYTRELAHYWQHDYDWRRIEQKLNGWPQFKTTIDDIDIHFIHRRSPEPDAMPIIITHGWPGSVVEFHKVIDVLADPVAHGGTADQAFHVVVPSLPGFGFSGKPSATGTGVEAIARSWEQLMQRLGYQHYVAQGGDWGSYVTHQIALLGSGHCDAIHVNMPAVLPDRDTYDQLTPQEKSALEGIAFYRDWDSGYSKQQSTRPQTLGYALADSPVGQMAWIVEKFYAWCDCEKAGAKHPENALSKDEMLDNVMLYWLTNSAASSAKLYWESFSNADLTPIDTPVGVSIFPGEIFRASRRWAEKRYLNLTYWNEPERGGHFAAFEQPALFVEELRNCFRPQQS